MFFPPSSLYVICLYTHLTVGVAQWILLFKRNMSLANMMMMMMVMHILCDFLFLLLCGLFFKERYDFWVSQNFAVNINCSFFSQSFNIFFSWCYDFWIHFFLAGIHGPFSYVPVWCPFFSMDLLAAGAKGYEGESWGDGRGWRTYRVYWHAYLQCDIQPKLTFITQLLHGILNHGVKGQE